MLLSDRTKVTRGVLGFLALCAVLGFIMGLKGALPTQVYDESEGAPLAQTPSGVVVEAAPADETPAPVEEEKTEAEEPAEEEKPAEAPAPAPQPAPPEPAPAPAREEAPPADPVGDLLEQQQPDAQRPLIY